MIPKSKIRLSRRLHAQTTPYPEIGRFMRRGLFLLLIFVSFGIYLAARENRKGAPAENQNPKQILGSEAPAADYLIYEIKKGDTLFNVSSRYGFTWQTIAELNGLREPYLLKAGQKIKIPATAQ